MLTLADTATDLRNAKAIISDPNKWGRHYYAADEGGDPVDHDSPEATCFCTFGAVMKAVSCDEDDEFGIERTVRLFQCEATLEASLPIYDGDRYHTVIGFNDDPDTTHDDVMALYDRAIARCNNGEQK